MAKANEKTMQEVTAQETTNTILSNISTIMEKIAEDKLPDDAVEKAPDNTELIRKEYALETYKGKRESVTIYNPEIIKSVEKIRFAQTLGNTASYIICRELAHLSENGEELTRAGFDSTADFAAHVFGFARATADQYIRIGKYFIGDDYRPVKVLPSSLSISHMNELLTINDSETKIPDLGKIAELYATGKLVDGMSKAALRKVVQNFKHAIEAPKNPEIPEAPEKTASTKTEKGSKDSKGTDHGQIMDALSDMVAEEATATMLRSLDVIRKIVDKFVTDEKAKQTAIQLITALQDCAATIA